MWGELGLIRQCTIKELKMANINKPSSYSLDYALVYGTLPGIASLPERERGDFLESYGRTYLEEEIRAEALSRKIGAFSKFLELAAQESGTSPNLSKLSNESGVSVPAVKEFYSVLEDTLVVERVEPYLKNARKRLFSSPRYYFFDLGVRNTIARLPLSAGLVNAQKGVLFEHFVLLEIIRRVRALGRNYRVNFWRAVSGAKVDCVVDTGSKLIPIEIKSGEKVGPKDLTGLRSFMAEYPGLAKEAYVVTQGRQNEKVGDRITAVPWFNL
jgi:hypothetical protein